MLGILENNKEKVICPHFNLDFHGEKLESVTRHPAYLGAIVLAALATGSR